MKRLGVLWAPLFFGTLFLITTSCNNNKPENVSETNKDTTYREEVNQPKNKPAENDMGEKIYMDKCITCHQANGKGIPKVFPPLAQSDYLLNDKVGGAIQVLKGSHKDLVVNGVTYNSEMPPQVFSSEEAVAVIKYVLNHFGNPGGTITIDEVNNKLKEVK